MKKTLSWLIVLAMVFAMIPAVFAAEESEAKTFTKVAATDVTEGTYLIYGISAQAMSDGTNSAFMTSENPASERQGGVNLTIEGDSVTTDDTTAMWELIAGEGGFYIKSVAEGKYLYYTGTSNKISETDSLETAQVWSIVERTSDAGNGYTLSNGTRYLSCNRFGTSPNNYMGFATYATNTNCACLIEFYKLDEAAEEEPEIPVEPETPAGDLVLGDNVLTMEANASVLEQTYIATEAGTLTFEFTKLAYQGTQGMTDKPVAEAFAGANDTTPWFTVTIDGVGLAAKYKGAVEVEAGQTVTLKVEHTGTPYFLGKVREMTVNLALEAGSSEGDDVVEPIEGEIFNVETTDNNGYFDTYTFVAPVSGEYTFHIPAGLGLHTPEAFGNFEQPIIDYYDNADGYIHVIDLYAGQEYEVMVGAQEKAEWEIIYTVVEKEVERPTEPGAPVEPPVEGSTVIEGSASINSETLYSYEVEANGTLTINAASIHFTYGDLSNGVPYTNGFLVLVVNGVEVDSVNAGVYTMDVLAGETVTIKVLVKTSMYQGTTVDLVLELAQEVPAAPSVELGTTEIALDTIYNFVATEAGTLKIDASTGSGISSGVYPPAWLILDVNGEAVDGSAKGVYEIEVVAGDVVAIQVIKNSSMIGNNTKVNLILSMVQEEVVVPPAGNGTGTEADPFIIDELPATLTGTLSMDGEFHKYIAEKDGVIVAEYAGFLVTVKVNGENKNLPLTVVAGDEIVFNPWSMSSTASYELKLSYEVEEPEQPEEPEEPEVGSGSGTQNDPIILSSENQTVEHAGGDLYYQWIAPADGTLKVTFNGGACLLTGSSVGSWETMDGGRMLEVAKGDKISINFWSGTAFTIAFEEASEEFNGILLEGNSVELKRGDASLYAWTASADGKFIVEIKSSTFRYGYTLTVNGQTMGTNDVKELILDVKAGDLIIVEFTTNAGASTDWVMTLSGEMYDGSCRHEYVDGFCTKCGEAKEPDGTKDYPFIMGNQNETYAYESTPAWFQFTAEADTTLTIKTDWTKYHMLMNATIDGASISPTSVTENGYKIYTIEVKAGSVLKFSVYATTSSADEMIVEVQQQVACQHTNTRVEGAVEADCGNAGHTGKTVCADCGEEISAGEVIPATGEHNFIEGSCGICGEADPDYVPECEHNYVDGVCTNCGEADPDYVPEQPDEPSNPGTGSMNILAIALIAMMSATAVVVTAKKSDEE